MKKKKLFNLLIILFASLFILSGCSFHKSEQKYEHLNFAVSPSISSLPLYVAQEKGFFKKHHLSVTLTNVNLNYERVNGLKHHQFNGAIVDIPKFMMFGVSNAKLVAQITGYTALLTKNNNINNISDLSNKRIATIGNSMSNYDLFNLINKNKLQVKLVSTPNSEELVNYFNENTVDAVLVSDPNISLLSQLGGRIIWQSKPNEANLGVIFSNNVIKKNPKDIRKFIKSYDDAVNYINEHPDINRYRKILLNDLSYPDNNLDSIALPHFDYADNVSKKRLSTLRQWLVKKGITIGNVRDYVFSVLDK